ncbi:hypothetical protein I7I51_05944 [Histoplasma capsulatum]|uniref:Aminoglycoside phosphotransferase domain-containing protein n=1 Tax=Ajellomyces capsulatus TaxID=5037 RepID=A0A8A1MKB4_AJECA|nr:hypothetical protein I7I51_05944 [Histoplasma capsulatum]
MSNQRHNAPVFLHAKFDVSALLHLVQRLRNVPCTCDLTQRPRSGSLNWVIFLTFDDGVEWVFRSPRTCYSLDEETAGVVLASEAATIKYIRENSSIPVPEVFYYRLNEIGVPFILMSKAQGSPLSTRSWHPQPYQIPKTARRQCLKQQEKEKIMRQLGDIISQLSHLRFDTMGSLFEEEGCFSVKTCLSPGLLLQDRHTLQEFFRGPFCSEKDYYKSLLSAFLQHIQFLTLEHHAFFAPVPVPAEYNSYDSYLSATDKWNDFVTLGSKIDSSKNRLDYFIAGQFLESMIPSFTTESDATMSSFEAGYPLHHPDLSVNNIFVDEDYNITCIIDWAFSSSVPIAMLLATPGLPHPRDEIEPALDSAFRARVAKYFMREKNVTLHQTVWEMTRKDYNLFAELYRLIYGQQMSDIPTMFKEQYGEPAVLDMEKILAADDQSSSDIERNEKAYFSNVEPHSCAIRDAIRVTRKTQGCGREVQSPNNHSLSSLTPYKQTDDANAPRSGSTSAS